MAKGNAIIVSSEPKGVYLDGILSGTPKPGTCMELMSTAEVAGAGTWRVYQPGTDGNQRLVAVLLENYLLGGLNSAAFATGDRIMIYCPLPGEEMNCIFGDVSGTGTGSDITRGAPLIIDSGTGELVNSVAASVESEPFMSMETVSDLTADYLLHVMATGY